MEATTTERSAIDTFIAVTGMNDEALARSVLTRHGWDITTAVDAALNGERDISPVRTPTRDPMRRLNAPSATGASLSSSVAPRRTPPRAPSTGGTAPRAIVPTQSVFSGWWNFLVAIPFLGLGFRFTYTIIYYALTPLRYLLSDSPRAIADAAAIEFPQRFEAKYGIHRPAFVAMTYKEAVAASHAANRNLLVYLHSPLHQDTDRFARGTLCSEAFVNFSAGAVCWGGSLDTKDGYSIAQLLRASAYPFVALMHAESDGAGRFRVTIIDKSEGLIAADALLAKMHVAVQRAGQIRDAMEAQRVAEMMDRENLVADRRLREQQERDHLEAMRADEERLRKLEADRLLAAAAEDARAEREEIEEAVALSSKLSTEFDLNQKRSAIILEPAPGTKDVTQLRINLPSGAKLQRRFPHTAKLFDIRNFLDVDFADKGIAITEYDLATNYPKKTFTKAESNVTLAEAGLIGNVMLFVYDPTV